jgi:hypothetical protein
MRKRVLFGLALVVIFAIVGCDPNRERRESLRSEIARLDPQLRVEGEAVGGGRSKVASLEKVLYEQQAELENFKGRFEAYLIPPYSWSPQPWPREAPFSLEAG